MVEINNLVEQAVANAAKRRQQALNSQINLSEAEAQQVKGGKGPITLPITLGYCSPPRLPKWWPRLK